MLKIKNYLIIIISFLVYSKFFSYCLERPDVLPLKPTYLIVLIFIISSIFMLLLKNNRSYLYPKINYWILFYLVIYLFWFAFQDNYLTIEEFYKSILTILATFLFVVFLSFDDNNLTYGRTGILFATLIAGFNNVYEFLNPFAFFPLGSEIGVMGRSAGFALNPTISGTMLIIGFILSIGLIQERYRISFTLLVLLAVILTFSRSAIIGIFLILIYFNYTKVINIKQFTIVIFLAFFSLIYFLPNIIEYIEKTFSGGSDNLINRILWFMNPDERVDFSQKERKLVAYQAWILFSNNIFLGSGIGSTTKWNLAVSSHNMYLNLAGDFGLIGLVTYPLLILSSIYNANKRIINTILPFTIFTLYIGFFSHNLLTDFYFLYAVVLVSIMSHKSNKKEGVTFER